MERLLRILVLSTRWVLGPIYVGMFAALVVIAVKFVQEFATTVPRLPGLPATDTFLFALSMIDLALVANLVLMVVGSGTVYFLTESSDAPKPVWLSHAGPAAIKSRLLASIVAISAIEVLKNFMHIADIPDRVLTWSIGIFLAFVVSAVLIGLSDWLETKSSTR